MGIKLPPGYNSPTELATVLANEPDAARFASTTYGQDSITFRDDSAAGGPSERRHSGDDETDADVAEFDSQIEQINQDLKKTP